MEFLFEKYIDFCQDKVFLGYKSVIAFSLEEALRLAKEKEDPNIQFVSIANPVYYL